MHLHNTTSLETSTGGSPPYHSDNNFTPTPLYSAIACQSSFFAIDNNTRIARGRNSNIHIEFQYLCLLLLEIGAVITLGLLTCPTVPIGLLVGTCTALISMLTAMLWRLMSSKVVNNDSQYLTGILENRFYFSVIAPTIEELLFRGGLQPLLILTIAALVPPLSTAMLLSTGLSITSAIAIAVTSLLFGFMHIFNAHDLALMQAMNAAILGITFGVVAVQYGIITVMAAHIIHNTIVITTSLSMHMLSAILPKKLTNDSNSDEVLADEEELQQDTCFNLNSI